MRALGEHDGPALLRSIFDKGTAPQVERTLEVAVRLAEAPRGADLVALALVPSYGRLVDRSTQQARGETSRPGSEAMAVALGRAHTSVLTDERVGRLPLEAQSQLSAYADRLGDLLVEHGSSSIARVIFEQAAGIDERKLRLEPGNTTYRRDVSISYDKLAELALAAGRSGDAEQLYRQALQVAEDLTRLEPGNTTYRRDVSISYERLADLAVRAGTFDVALELANRAVAGREALAAVEPTRRDFAVELGFALYLRYAIRSAAGDPSAGSDPRQTEATLAPFEANDLLDARGQAILDWSRSQGAADTEDPGNV